MASKKKQTKYTVVGLYDELRQPWVVSVEARDPDHAARMAIVEVCRMNGWPIEAASADGIGVVEVFEGEVKGVLGNDFVQWGDSLLQTALEDGEVEQAARRKGE